MKVFIVCLVVASAAASVRRHHENGNFVRNHSRHISSSESDESHGNLGSNDGFSADSKWHNFKASFQKSYNSHEEEAMRYGMFMKNDAKIKAHNQKYAEGKVFYKMGHNQFSDMSSSEIELMKPEIKRSLTHMNTPHLESLPDAPETVSYKESCLPVMNQGRCGSCWAFAAAAQVETQLKRKDPNYNTPISPQYLLDCAPNEGCKEGGYPIVGLDYLYNVGLVSSKTDPYVAFKKSCDQNMSKMSEKISSQPKSLYLKGDEDSLKQHLAAHGPLVISIYASDNFSYYEQGVFSEEGCSKNCKKTNHAVLLVGYGTDTSFTEPIHYWLIKNSYGRSWGENGYMRMIRNHPNFPNNCNVACFADFAKV